MKRLILLAVMTAFTATAMAQTQHYTLAQCNNDILKYIELNYEDNGARYKDKTMDAFINECELTLKDFVPSVHYQAEGYDKDNGKIDGITFYIYKDNYRYSLSFSFRITSTSSTIDNYRQISSKTHRDTWQQKFYDFFKGYVIDDVWVLKRKDGKPIKNYRRP